MNKQEKDNKENRNKMWVKEDVFSLSKEDIPCRRCGKQNLATDTDINGNDLLRCQECGRANYNVISELHEEQRIKANIKGLYKAVISKCCTTCKKNLEFKGRTQWSRFSNKNQWSCPDGCTRKQEFHDSKTVKIKRGKVKTSIYEIVPSKKVAVGQQEEVFYEE